MKKRMMKIAACMMAASITFGSTGILTMAAGADVPLAGLQAKVEENNEVNQSTENTAPAEPSKYDGLAIAQVNDDAYVNIRDAASTEDGKVLGKLYNNSAAEILGQEGDWYLIKSGSVTGYVNKEFFATGAQAEELAKEVGEEVATVNTTTLMVRQDPNTDSDVVTLVGDAEKLQVEEDLGDWVKVAVDSDVVGYVAKDYVECDTKFVEAESKEEEEARIAAEEAAYLAAVEEARKADEAAAAAAAAEQAAQDKAWLEYLDSQEQAAANQAAQEAADAQSAADALAAQQAAAEQEAADAAAKAQEAADQAAAEQAAADAQAQAEAAAQAAADAQAQADAQAKAAADAQAAADAAAQQQQQQTEGSQSGGNTADNQEQQFGDASGGSTEAPDAGQSSSASGLRQSVVSFALQFVGNPYVWGGTSLTNGADCSGFTQSVMANFGISIPRVAAAQAGSGRVVDLGSIQPGDLLFYNGDGGIGHVSMYIGNNQVVHASSSTTGIIVSDMGYRQPCSARSYLD
ncbi:MAG: C40 family peptidase [Clostridiales bacterium]|nr:C40 family peptidase [Clostridiales bacterium]